MREMYAIGEVIAKTGISRTTLARWHNSGKFVAQYVSDGGKKYYSAEQLASLSGHVMLDKPARKVIGYARVSSHDQKADLVRQQDLLMSYLTAQGQPFEIISDLGSGMNFKKKGFLKLLQMIENDEISKIVVTYKDRLLRFGFELIEMIAKQHNTTIEIINQTDNVSDEAELTQDLIEIITVFSARLYGKRSHKHQALMNVINDN